MEKHLLPIMCCSLAFFSVACASELSKFQEDVSSTPIRYRRLTFSNSASGSNLSNFPVMIRLNSARIDYARMQTAGQDLRFYDADSTTALSYEIEKWDSTGESIVWVKVPQIDALSASDSIVMRYGDTTLTDAQSVNAVWVNGYAGVWHFASGSNALKDSTQNANHATNFSSTEITGVTGSARQVLSAGGQYLRAGTTGMAVSQGTVEIFAYPISTMGFNQSMFALAIWDGSAGNRIYLSQRWMTDVNDFVTSLGSGGSAFVDSGGNLTANSWSHCVMTWSGGNYAVYLNGNFLASGTISGFTAVDTQIFFGSGSSSPPSFSWDGRLDEARVSSVARSADWVAAQYKSMNDTFVSFGAEYK